MRSRTSLQIAVVAIFTWTVLVAASDDGEPLQDPELADLERTLPGDFEQVPPEYCEAETFHAKCADDEVVMIKEARYGRMRHGRCVIRNYGYLGCSADVLPHLDWKCSGKTECEVRIPDAALDRVNPCPKDLKTYLEVDYECIKVVTPPCHACAQENNSVVVSGEFGHLASSAVVDADCGTPGLLCPWVIKESEGRRINLTLYDFSVPEDEEAYPPSFGCDRLASIKELDAADNDRQVELCSGTGRETLVYTSQTSVIEIKVDPSFVMGGDVTDQRRFVIKYEAFGCPDISTPANAWLKREGDVMIVGCEATETTYHLTCEGTRWTGTMGSCPQTVSTELSDPDLSHAQPMGIMVATAIGIALIIGSLVLTVGLVYVRRRGLNQVPRQPAPPGPIFPQAADPRLIIMSKMGNYCSPECQKACYQAILSSKYKPNDYEYAMEMRPLPDAPDQPLYDVTCGSSFTRHVSRQSSLSGSHYNPSFPRLLPSGEHIYRTRGGGSIGGLRTPRYGRHYFELDPDHIGDNNPPNTPKPKKVTTEERQNKTNRGKEFTRQGSFSGPLLTTFGKNRSDDDSASKDLLENENSSKFSWP